MFAKHSVILSEAAKQSVILSNAKDLGSALVSCAATATLAQGRPVVIIELTMAFPTEIRGSAYRTLSW
jgi:hypothetical protein